MTGRVCFRGSSGSGIGGCRIGGGCEMVKLMV